MKLSLFVLAAVIIWNLDDFIDACNRPEIQRIESQERVDLLKSIQGEKF